MIALINGSPKFEGSSSELLLDRFEKIESENSAEFRKIHFAKGDVSNADIEVLKACDTWAFFFPLYVDAVPGHLVECLLKLQDSVKEKKNIYPIVCMGFFEPVQTRHALAVIENFCEKCGFNYGGGLGIGGAGAFGGMKGIPLFKGPLMDIDKALWELRENILRKKTEENKYAELKFPRFLYKLAGEMNWKKTIKQNGGKSKDLGKRISI